MYSLSEKVENIEKKLQREDIERILQQALPKIVVIGVGGGGNNACTRLTNLIGSSSLIKIVAANTDAWQLYHSRAHIRLLLGPKLLRGRGAGNRPELGERATYEVEDQIRKILSDRDLVIITATLGGGTGSGASPVIAKIAREMNSVVVGIFTLPFTAEGSVRMQNAINALEKLSKYAHTLIVIPNDKLLEIASNLTISDAFNLCDDILIKTIIGITDLVTKPGLIHVDFNDVAKVLTLGGFGFVGIGEADGTTENRTDSALIQALRHPLLVFEPARARGCLVNITGGKDLTLQETHRIMRRLQAVFGRLDYELILGVRVDEKFPGLRVTLIMGGIQTTIEELLKTIKKPRELPVESQLDVYSF